MDISVETMMGELFLELFPIDWMRVTMFAENNKYERIPVLIYRYQKGFDKMYQNELEKCVGIFKGRQKWTIFRSFKSRNENYLLTLQSVFWKMKECEKENRLYIEKKEFSKNWKNICDEAIEDIPHLTEHIRTYMSKLF